MLLRRDSEPEENSWTKSSQAEKGGYLFLVILVTLVIILQVGTWIHDVKKCGGLRAWREEYAKRQAAKAGVVRTQEIGTMRTRPARAGRSGVRVSTGPNRVLPQQVVYDAPPAYQLTELPPAFIKPRRSDVEDQSG